MSAVALMLLRLPVRTFAHAGFVTIRTGFMNSHESRSGCVRASKSDARNSESALFEFKNRNAAVRKTGPRHLNAVAVYLSETAPCSEEYTILRR